MCRENICKTGHVFRENIRFPKISRENNFTIREVVRGKVQLVYSIIDDFRERFSVTEARENWRNFTL